MRFGPLAQPDVDGALVGGASLLVRAQVSTMKDFWYDKVEVSIFLCGKVSDTPSCAAGAVTDAQKQAIYHVWKNAISIPMDPVGDGVYRFDYQSVPLPGNAAPSSLQTSPSQITSTAAITHAIKACGPCIAAMNPGIVMNGPIPIMFVMFSAVA